MNLSETIGHFSYVNPIDELGQIFITTPLFRNAVDTTNIGKIYSGMATDGNFENNLNIDFPNMLTNALRQQPTLLYDTRNGIPNGEQYDVKLARAHNTSMKPLRSGDEIAAVPPLVKPGSALLSNGENDYYPLKTVEVHKFSSDIKGIWEFSNAIHELAVENISDPTYLTSKEFIHAALQVSNSADGLLNNCLWSDMRGAYGKNKYLSPPDYGLGGIIDYFKKHWWTGHNHCGDPFPLAPSRKLMNSIKDAIAELAKTSSTTTNSDIEKKLMNKLNINQSMGLLVELYSLNFTPSACCKIISGTYREIISGDEMVVNLLQCI